MADKKISDFATLTDVQSNDLLLVSSSDETYNIKAKVFMDSIGDDVFDKINDTSEVLLLNDDDYIIVSKNGELGQATVDTLVKKVGGVVHYDKAQTLTTSQKQTARSNINAPSADELETLDLNAVHVDRSQNLSQAKKKQARDNIDVPSKGELSDVSDNVVHADKAQTFSSGYKQQARDNIDAASKAELATVNTNLSGDISTLSSNVVHVDQEQTLSSTQKSTGRANIDAVSTAQLQAVENELIDSLDDLNSGVVHVDEVQTLTDAEKKTGRDNINAADADDLEKTTETVESLLISSLTAPLSMHDGRIETRTWNVSSNYRCSVIPVQPQRQIIVTANSNYSAEIAVLTEYSEPNDGDTAQFSSDSDWDSVVTVAAGNTFTGVLPSDAAYLYVIVENGSRNRLPIKCVVGGYDYCLTAKENIVIDNRLLNSAIKDTRQVVVYTGSNVTGVNHVDFSDHVVRADTFVTTTNPMVETRTLDTGERLTISTNLTTLTSTITYTPASA